MSLKRILSLTAALTISGMIGCSGDRDYERTEREIFTEPALETVEIDVMTEDTMMVERTYETEVEVDTMEVEGGTLR